MKDDKTNDSTLNPAPQADGVPAQNQGADDFCNYTQTVDVEGKSVRLQILGLISFMLAVGFIMLAAFISPYWAIAAAAFIAAGIAYFHFFNLTARKYIYSASQTRLVIAKCDAVNRTRRMLNILYADVQSFGKFEGATDRDDYIAAASISDIETYQIIFNLNGVSRRLVFSPDRYLTARLQDALKDKCDFSDAFYSDYEG